MRITERFYTQGLIGYPRTETNRATNSQSGSGITSRTIKNKISVLTGVDYWLDNLTCNVPEVVMCYHLHGIVQKYELIKMEDLPNLDNSKFSPKVIRDVAQNILIFLKNNTINNIIKAGHTYWLFKSKF